MKKLLNEEDDQFSNLSFSSQQLKSALSNSYQEVTHFELSPSQKKKLSRIFKNNHPSEILFSTLAILFYILNQYKNYSFYLNTADTQTTILTTQLSDAENFKSYLSEISSQKSKKNSFHKKIKAISFHPFLCISLVTTEKYLKQVPLERKSILHVIIDQKETSFRIAINQIYQKDCLLSQIVQQIPEHIATIIEQMTARPKIKIQDLNILSQNQEEIFKKNALGPQQKYPRRTTLHHLFEKQAEKYPNNTAICFNGHNLSYGSLNEKANQLARYLKKNRVKKNHRVGICMEQNTDSLVAILGVLKAGACYVPIDMSCPEERIKNILEDCKPTIVITQNKFHQILIHILKNSKHAPKLFALDNEIKTLSAYSVQNPCYRVTGKNLAYIIYTSGSTGMPKGVLIPHSNVINLLDDFQRKKKLSEKDHCVLWTNIGFDVSVYEIFSALLSGASLCLLDQETRSYDQFYFNALKKHKISSAYIPPFMLNPFLQWLQENADYQDLKRLLVGVEPIEEALLSDIKQHFNDLTIINGYGPTECTVCSTLYTLPNQPHKIHQGITPIGKPIQNYACYVLNKYQHPVPIGIPGELYVAGDGVAQGYLNRPKLTHEKFVTLTIQQKKTRCYRTGDLVYWLPDHEIKFIGRSDNQVKLRGYRIELSSIASHLLHHERIDRAEVVVQQDRNRQKSLFAYIMLIDKKQKVSLDELKNFLKTRIPTYMVPDYFIIVDQLPLTPNKKVDIKKLTPSLGFLLTPKKTVLVPPKTELQKTLQTIWARILKLKPNEFGIHSDFFSLGGNSLLFSSVLSEISHLIPIEACIVRDFFDDPTILHLAHLITHSKQSDISEDTDKKPRYPEFFLEDIQLSPQISACQCSGNFHRPQNILITGGNGFLGTYLIYELYRSLPKANIYCLIRTKNSDEARKKLNQSFSYYFKNKSLLTSKRIIAIAGDLSEKKLGLTSSEFHELSEKIDVIYHSGAQVHHVYSYGMLRKTNVLSTIELLKLATSHHLKQVNYMSTLSIAPFSKDPLHSYITENFITLKDYEHLAIEHMNGYTLSKWASEAILTQAKERGIPVNIFRPAWIMGSTKTSIFIPEHNHLFLLIKGCIQLGFSPDWAENLYMIPIDICSRFIVRTAIKKWNNTSIYNIFSPHTMTWKELIHWLNQYGYSVKIIKNKMWLKKLQTIDTSNALFPLLSLYLNSNQQSDAHLPINRCSYRNTHKTLLRLRYQFPPISIKLLKRYFDYLKKAHFMPSKN